MKTVTGQLKKSIDNDGKSAIIESETKYKGYKGAIDEGIEAEEHQKPSERIKEMATNLHKINDMGLGASALILIDSILDYLDEQYEKENHE